MCKKEDEREADSMTTASVEYNKKIFLAELEESLKEMSEKKKCNNTKTKQSSWGDLFAIDKK